MVRPNGTPEPTIKKLKRDVGGTLENSSAAKLVEDLRNSDAAKLASYGRREELTFYTYIKTKMIPKFDADYEAPW